MKEFSDELEEGFLDVLVVDDVSDTRSCLIKMLANVDTDWVVLSGSDLWSSLGALQCQLRRILEDPCHDSFDGPPKLWSKKYCLTEQGLLDMIA